METFTVEDDDAGVRLDVFLAGKTGFSRSRLKNIIDGGYAVSPDGSPLKPSYRIEKGDLIRLTVPPREEPSFEPESIPLDIVYEDEYLAVVNKPPGMVVHPGRGNMTGTLASGLLHRFGRLSEVGGAFRPGIVHRLDKDTSGLIVTALTDQAHRMLAHMLQDRTIVRVYTAYVWGRPDPPDGTIDAPIGRHPAKPTLKAVVEGGRPSVTHYETVACYDFLTKLLVTLETGRTHQIRVHLSGIGHHVFGDPSYGGREERLGGFRPEYRQVARRLLADLDRQALHAGTLAFRHPVTGEHHTFTTPLPPDLLRLEKALAGE
ncbi:MAG: RluA family pseudouridine synthase [Candidatus Latescibacteria bacterium]|nr:RluA family pseudouridine synthase [Candidatus Latescibacterota bacterium]